MKKVRGKSDLLPGLNQAAAFSNPQILTVNERNRQSAEQMCQRPRGSVYGQAKLSMDVYGLIKRSKASQRKFVFLRCSSPDVQGEGGGGKTNISLLESSEEWAPGSATPTVRDRAEELGEKMKNFSNETNLILVSWWRFPNVSDKNKKWTWASGEVSAPHYYLCKGTTWPGHEI